MNATSEVRSETLIPDAEYSRLDALHEQVKLWPDSAEKRLEIANIEFAKRERAERIFRGRDLTA